MPTKEELSKEINEVLFGDEDKLDLFRLKKSDLIIFREMLNTKVQEAQMGARLLSDAGVGQGMLMNVAQNILQSEGEINLKKFIGMEEEKD